MRNLNKVLAAAIGLFLTGSAAFATATSLTPFSPQSVYSTYASSAADVTEAVADASNGNVVAASGHELVFAHNTDTAAHTITFTSVADQLGRTGDITSYSVAAGKISCFGPFPLTGWQNGSGQLKFTANDTTVKLFVVKLPN